MTIETEDILFTLSGGSSNSTPDNSLGGEPSPTTIVDALNNIYDDVTKEESSIGDINYRCIYIFNNNGVDSLFDSEVFTESQVDGGASVEIGIDIATDLQRLTISGTVTGGSIELSYEGDSFTAAYDANIGVWANNFQTSINALSDLSGVIVTGSSIGGNRFFEFSFAGNDDRRNHELMVIEDTSGLIGSFITIIAKLVEGSPVNSIAPSVEFETVEPFGVTFDNFDVLSPLFIGTLNPFDGYPIWFKRTTEAGTSAVLGDGFSLQVSGSPIATP